MLTLAWRGGMAFEATPPSGNRFVMDAAGDAGGADLGPTPVEALIGAIAACCAMDVVSILAKKRQVVTSYRVEVDWRRGPEGEWPRPVTSVVLRHILAGDPLDPEAVRRSIELSDTKYCTVIATLRHGVQISSEFEIEPATLSRPA